MSDPRGWLYRKVDCDIIVRIVPGVLRHGGQVEFGREPGLNQRRIPVDTEYMNISEADSFETSPYNPQAHPEITPRLITPPFLLFPFTKESS